MTGNGNNVKLLRVARKNSSNYCTGSYFDVFLTFQQQKKIYRLGKLNNYTCACNSFVYEIHGNDRKRKLCQYSETCNRKTCEMTSSEFICGSIFHFEPLCALASLPGPKLSERFPDEIIMPNEVVFVRKSFAVCMRGYTVRFL